MKRVWPLLLVGILFLTGIAGSFLLMKQPDGSVVEIVQDNQVLYRFNLDQTENQTIEVEYETLSNTIEIRNLQIRMAEAECPDHTCVQMGWLDSAVPIVCLPNHLVIQFREGGGFPDNT